jgi:endonuclease/exonuclease/phosphatase family metal-dependent hydrolase
MKIIQVNAWLGRLLPTLLDFISQQNADILCCQEIFSSQQPNPLMETTQTLEHIQKAGDFKEVFFSPTSSFSVFGEEVFLGNAIFSKHSISEKKTIFTSSNFHANQEASSWIRNIRNLQLCTINTSDNKRLNIANHHGYHELDQMGSDKTSESIKKLVNALSAASHPLIFCADLNIVKESPYFSPLKDLGLRNLTAENNTTTTLSPAHRIYEKEQVACDYIMCSPDIAVNEFTVSDALMSDHKALVLDFGL